MEGEEEGDDWEYEEVEEEPEVPRREVFNLKKSQGERYWKH